MIFWIHRLSDPYNKRIVSRTALYYPSAIYKASIDSNMDLNSKKCSTLEIRFLRMNLTSKLTWWIELNKWFGESLFSIVNYTQNLRKKSKIFLLNHSAISSQSVSSTFVSKNCKKQKLRSSQPKIFYSTYMQSTSKQSGHSKIMISSRDRLTLRM